MSLATDLENAVKRVVAEAEKAGGEAEAEVLRLAGDAKKAEAAAVQRITVCKAELAALAGKYGPELAQLGESLLADVKALFRIG